ncbi:MAG TPA: hypothetical protein VGG39_05160 [Polyangiaceae bacterium]|jgi:hypothetical protein
MIDDVRWLHRWPRIGPITFRVGRAGEHIVAEWPGLGVLRTDVSGSDSHFAPVGAAVAGSLRDHFDEIVAALLGHLNGGMTLHASCVARGDVGIGFLGDSGAGKSTLAMRLCALHDAELLSDDVMGLRFAEDRIDAMPTETHHWLRTDVAREMSLEAVTERRKVPLLPRRHAGRPTRLKALVSLTFGDVDTPLLVRLRGAEAFAALSIGAFRLGLDVFAPMRSDLDNLAHIARETEVFELRRRRTADCMNASVQVVSDLLDELRRGGSEP